MSREQREDYRQTVRLGSKIRGLQSELTEATNICRARSQRPHKLALLWCDKNIIDAGLAALHQTIGIKFPLLIAMSAIPLTGRIVELISEARRDPIVEKAPNFRRGRKSNNQQLCPTFRSPLNSG